MISHFLLKTSFDKASEKLKAKQHEEPKNETLHFVKNNPETTEKNE